MDAPPLPCHQPTLTLHRLPRRIVFGAWLGIIAASGSRSTLGTIQTYVLEHQLSDMDPSSVAWIFSFYTFNSLAWGLIVGPLFDVYGSGWLLMGGSGVLCLAFFLVGLCGEFWHCGSLPLGR